MIPPEFLGFRAGLGTDDYHATLETEIRMAFENREHMVSIFFDLEKAYDITWRHGILQTLIDFSIKENLLHFVAEFMKDRRFHVRMGGTRSNNYHQANGLPKGSVMSVVLFIVALLPLQHILPGLVKFLMYADDLSIHIRSKNINIIEEVLQLVLDSLVDWENRSGFKISSENTKAVHPKLATLGPSPSLSWKDTRSRGPA